MINDKSRLKIMHVIWGLSSGGAERQVVTIATSQAKQHSVIVCCFEGGGELIVELEDAGIEVIVLNKKVGFDLAALLNLKKILSTREIDLVHSHIWSANLWTRLAAILARTKYVVIHEHSMFAMEKKYRQVADYFLSWFTDAVICVSSQILYATTHSSRISMTKTILIRNGIELSKFNQSAEDRVLAMVNRSKQNLPPKVVIVGSLEPRKNHKSFIRAACFLLEEGIDAEFLIIGDGPLRSELEEMVKGIGKEKYIKFIGNQKSVFPFLIDASVYVSSSFTEGISIAMLEAIAARVPVVATAVGGNNEIARSGNNLLLVSPEDTEALAKGIEALLDCRGAGNVLAENAYRDIYSRFNKDNMNRRIDLLYENLSTKRQRTIRWHAKRIARWGFSRLPIFFKIFKNISLPAGTIQILMYHRIREGAVDDRLSVSTTEFTRQLAIIEDNHIPIMSLSSALSAQAENKLPFGAIVISFDDGYSDMLTDALPILNEFNAVGTLYLPAELIESKKMIKRYQGDGVSRLLTWRECESLLAKGWEIGSHSLTHPNFNEISEEELTSEIQDSKRMIEEKLKIEVRSFAYPSGFITSKSQLLVDKEYDSAATVWPGVNYASSNKTLLSRIEISGEDTLADFVCKLKGGFVKYQRFRLKDTACNPNRIGDYCE